MKKIFFYIKLSLTIFIFLLPFGVNNFENKISLDKKIASADDCTILSAGWNPSGEQDKDNFYREGVEAKIVFKTKNCVDKAGINISVYEADSCPVVNCDDALSDSGLWRREIKAPTDNFTLQIKLGEEECEAGATLAIGYDCNLFFIIRNLDTTIYNSWNQQGGRIYYECDGACDINGALLKIIPQGTDQNPIKDEVVSVNTKKATENRDTYKLLAPIGNFTEINTSGGTCPGNPDIDNGIGCYLNIIFKIAIGLCGALAVIMIVIAGIQWMGTESVFGKTEAKSRIWSAVLGLFIALGAYAILNTIDPNLTGKNGVSVDQVEAVIDARDRADDPDFINNIDSLDISNININTSDYSDPSFLGYLAHQQGTAGASAILWAAKNGYSEVPANNPFARGNILRNMRNNFNPSSAQKTIGTSTLTPANFLKYWAIKVAASKRKTSPQIPSFIDNEIQKAASDTGVDVGQLRTMCRIESAGGCTTQASITTVNKFGYSGLFQLSKAVFAQYAKSGGDILSAYHNSYAAAQFYKFNLNGLNKNWDRINKK